MMLQHQQSSSSLSVMYNHDHEQGQEALLMEIMLDNSDTKKSTPSTASNHIVKSTLQQSSLNTWNNNSNTKAISNQNNNSTTNDNNMNSSMMRVVMVLSTENYNKNSSDADLAQKMLCRALAHTRSLRGGGDGNCDDTIVKEEMIVSALQNVSNESNMSELQNQARWLLAQAKQRQHDEKTNKKDTGIDNNDSLREKQQRRFYPRIMRRNLKNKNKAKKTRNKSKDFASFFFFRRGSTRRGLRAKGKKKRNTGNKIKKKNAWKSAVDPQSGRTYYYQRISKVSTWTKPSDFIENNREDSPIIEWATHVDPKTGKICYTNLITNETTFTRPGSDGDGNNDNNGDDKNDDQYYNQSSSLELRNSTGNSTTSNHVADNVDDVPRSDGSGEVFDGMIVLDRWN